MNNVPNRDPFLKADVAENVPFSFWILAIVSAFNTTSIIPILSSSEIQLYGFILKTKIMVKNTCLLINIRHLENCIIKK